MSRWVCNDITTGGRASFTIGCGIQVASHLLCDEGIEIHIMKTVPATTEGLGRVSRGTRRARTYRNACHGATKAWREKQCMKLGHTAWTQASNLLWNKAFWPTMQCYGFSERLQVCLHGAARLWGWRSTCRNHGNSGRGASCPWRWYFATQETDEVLASDSSSAFLDPCNHILIPALVA